jgi:hypothetical protein
MAIFNSYVTNYQRVSEFSPRQTSTFGTRGHRGHHTKALRSKVSLPGSSRNLRTGPSQVEPLNGDRVWDTFFGYEKIMGYKMVDIS